jgi:hypothetical protein
VHRVINMHPLFNSFAQNTCVQFVGPSFVATQAICASSTRTSYQGVVLPILGRLMPREFN